MYGTPAHTPRGSNTHEYVSLAWCRDPFQSPHCPRLLLPSLGPDSSIVLVPRLIGPRPVRRGRKIGEAYEESRKRAVPLLPLPFSPLLASALPTKSRWALVALPHQPVSIDSLSPCLD
jgi:hypothetical protein